MAHASICLSSELTMQEGELQMLSDLTQGDCTKSIGWVPHQSKLYGRVA